MKPLLVVDPEKCRLDELVRLQSDGFAVTVPQGQESAKARIRLFRQREATERLRLFKAATGL